MLQNTKGARSIRLVPSTAPATTIALLLDMYNKVHAASLKELGRPLTHVFQVCDTGSDDMDDA
jgi:hypothetical protein